MDPQQAEVIAGSLAAEAAQHEAMVQQTRSDEDGDASRESILRARTLIMGECDDEETNGEVAKSAEPAGEGESKILAKRKIEKVVSENPQTEVEARLKCIGPVV